MIVYWKKGQMGSTLMESLQTFRCFLTGTFFVPPLTYFYFPKFPGRSFFPNLSKSITFAAAPLVLTPFVRNQASHAQARLRRGDHGLRRARLLPRVREAAAAFGSKAKGP